MKSLAAIAVLLALATTSARAENCSTSRDYLLGSLAGDLKLPPQGYKDLFKICTTTLAMPNVKDAYILLDGGIAVIAKEDTVAATAATLSHFCDAYPKGKLRFLTRKEMLLTKSIVSVVQMRSTSATPCQRIKGIS